ncbi:MAG: hypothetical protein FWF99_05435 [Desulfovibrionaceae bacterium]|nr:hypothetical protein [Desulfovibrionaceae bacterium]
MSKSAQKSGTTPSEPNRKHEQTLLDSIQSEVSREASPLLEFLVARSRLIFFSLIGLILLIFAVGIWNHLAGNRSKDREEALGRIIILPESPDKLSQLEEFALKTDERMKNAAILALAHSASGQGEHETALRAWRRLSAPANTPLGIVVGLGEAETLGKLGQPAEGIARLEMMLPQASPQERSLINYLVVEMAEQAGDWSKAEAVCEEMIKQAGSGTVRDSWEQRLVYFQAKK